MAKRKSSGNDDTPAMDDALEGGDVSGNEGSEKKGRRGNSVLGILMGVLLVGLMGLVLYMLSRQTDQETLNARLEKLETRAAKVTHKVHPDTPAVDEKALREIQDRLAALEKERQAAMTASAGVSTSPDADTPPADSQAASPQIAGADRAGDANCCQDLLNRIALLEEQRDCCTQSVAKKAPPPAAPKVAAAPVKADKPKKVAASSRRANRPRSSKRAAPAPADKDIAPIVRRSQEYTDPPRKTIFQMTRDVGPFDAYTEPEMKGFEHLSPGAGIYSDTSGTYMSESMSRP